MELSKTNLQSDFITATQLRAWILIDRTTQHRWVKAGKLKAYKVGKKLFFKQSEVEKLLEENVVN
jgi:excisionase family DNA binding protein